MATKIYNTYNIYLFDGTEIEISPLKIKYLREFMDVFALIQKSANDEESINIMLECTRIAMKQYCPQLSKSIHELEENIDMPTVYKILEISAGIQINEKSEESIRNQAEKSEKISWENFDLLKIESEVFILGIWKNYDELETSLSINELMEILSRNRELDYEEKRFFAAIQGVDIEKGTEKDSQKKWEDMKARVFSKGATSDSNDVLALQGQNAKKAGFGIGYGLDYEDLTKPSV